MPERPPELPLPAGPETRGILARTARGAGWVIGWRMATRLLGLLSTLVLVRLLAPADFGLVSLANGFALALDALLVLGVEDALIRLHAPGRVLYDTGFTLNLIRGAATAAIVAAAAWPVAAFFNEPRLVGIMLALAVAALGSALANIGTLEFRRDLAFHKEFQLMILPRLAGICVTVTVALVFHSYWALVAGILTGRLLGVALGYAMHPYRPRLTLAAWRDLAGFSFWTWAVSVAVLVRDRLDSVVIGRTMNSTAVGAYAIGAEIATLPATELIEPLCRACFPGFAAARHGGMNQADTYLRIVAAAMTLTLPAGIGISLVADPIVKLAFGPGWTAVTPVVEILGATCTAMVFGYVSSTLFSANALLRPMFHITVAATLLRGALLIGLTPSFGLTGAAAAIGASVVAEQAVYLVLTVRRFGVGPARLLRTIWRPLCGTAAMAAALWGAGLGWTRVDGTPGQLALHLAAVISAGCAVYGGVVMLAWLASRRPAGPEADLLNLGRRLLRWAVRILHGASLVPKPAVRSFNAD